VTYYVARKANMSHSEGISNLTIIANVKLIIANITTCLGYQSRWSISIKVIDLISRFLRNVERFRFEPWLG